MTKYTRYSIILLFSVASLAFADQGPGDTYGYNWTDSGTPAPTISYSWIDLTGQTSLFGDVFDDSVASVTLPFSFTLYGTSSSQLYISSNGWISFSDPGINAYPANVAIPTAAAPNALIAPYWDDLASTTGNNGGVYYRTDGTSPNRRSIVEWNVINGTDAIHFQVILYERTNMIKFQYNTIDAVYDGGVSATIGIESNAGTSGNQYSLNTSGSVSAGSAILFHNEAVSNYSASLLPASVLINDFVTFTYTINNFIPTAAQNVGKIDRLAIGNPFSTTPTITSVTIDGQVALIQNTTTKPTEPNIATWFYKTSGPSDSLIVQTSLFNVGQSVVITYLQGIPAVPEGDYSYNSTVDASLYSAASVGTSSQPQVTVAGGAVDYIVIRDAPNGGGSVVGSRTMNTDQSLTLYAAGYDAGDNFIDDQDVTWTLTGTLSGGGGSGTNFIFNPSVAPTSGTIEAELVGPGLIDATGTIIVNPGALFSLQIRTAELNGGSPAPTHNMTTDDTQRFWAAGYDAEGNYRGDEPTTVWTSTLGIGGTGSSINYSPSAPITGTLTATIGSIDYVSAVQVTTGALDYLVVRDAPGGVGAVVNNRFINTDGSLTLYAAGYDAENNYKQDYVATWTLTGNLDGPGGTVSPYVFSPSTAPTSGTIIASVGNISDPTGTIDVAAGALTDLEIRTAPDNGGALVTTFPITTDDSQTFWAAGFDAEGNFRGNESVTWSSTLLGIEGTGPSILFEPDTPVTGTLTATSGIVSYTTGNIQVSVGSLDYLIIRDGPAGAGSVVTTVTMTTDDGLTLYAAGYDADGNFRQDEDATWTLTGSLDGSGSSGTSFSFNPSTAPTTGSILATVGGSTSDATGTITVNPGTLNYVLIRTAPNNGGAVVTTYPMTTDDSQTFWAAGYDAEDNYRGDESGAVWTSSGTLGISGGPSASILFAPTTPVSGTLTATVGGSFSYETGLISVSGGDVDHIVIRDAPDGGGNVVGNRTMTTDQTLTLYAAGYDAQDNFIENSVVNWSSTGGLNVTPVANSVLVFDPAVPATGTIVAQLGSMQDATGTITVNPGALNYVLIRNAANNGGSQVITLTMTTDESRTFWSAGYDAEDNYRGDESTTMWTSSGTLGINGGPSVSILFEPSVPVSGTLTATAGGATPYETGLIRVDEGSIDHIIVRDAPDGGGNVVGNRVMTTDETLTLYAAGYDSQDNFVQNAQVNWTLTGTLDGIELSDTVFVFDPAEAPTSGTINAQIGTIQDATGTITVNYGVLASVLIRSAANNGGNVVTTDNMSAGDSRTFWAAGYDGDGNYRIDEPATVWTSTFGLGDTGSSFLFTPTNPADGTITATVGGFQYTTGIISVTGGTLAYLTIRDGPGGTGNDLTASPISLTADTSLTLYAAGYDAQDNYIGDQIASWTSSGSLDDITGNGTTYTFNPVLAPRSGRIIATSSAYASQTGIISVSVGDLHHITINDAPGAGGTEVTTLTLTAGTTTTFYAVGYDSDDNYRSEVVVDWSSTGSIDAVTGTGTSINFNPLIAPAFGTIVADTAGLFTDATGLITVEEGLLDHLVIRTATDGEGVVVGDTNITADQSLTMYAAGYDASDNYIGDQPVSWSSTGSLDDIIANGTSYTFNPVLAPSLGTIVATSGPYSDQTGNIDVALGVFDHITINSSSGPAGVPVESLTMTADDNNTFWSASYDADNNFIAMIPATWDQTGNLDDVFGTGISYTFNPVTAPTSGTISATFSGQNDATGTITVNTGDLDHILITYASGVEIEIVSLNVGVDLVLESRGYDQDNNYRGRESAIWTSTGSLDDVYYVGQTYLFTPETAPTSGTIIATAESDPTKSDATGTITVDEGVLTYILIRTAPDGQGQEFGAHNMTTDDHVDLFAAGYDAGDNFIRDTSVVWSSTGTLETISASGTSFVFSPTSAPASGTIRATISGVLPDETGTITVSAGPAVRIVDNYGLSGERTTVAGYTQLISVKIEDQYGNGVPGRTVNFSPAGEMSVSSDLTDIDGVAESVYNTPRGVDSSLVQVSVPGLSPYNFTIYGINYVSSSLDPKVVQRGGSPTFTLQVSNPGNTTVPLSTGSSNFSFDNGSYSYSATLASPGSLAPNSPAINLTFVPTLIDENFPGGSYTGEIQLVGSGAYSVMNGVLQTDIGELTIGSGAITIGTIEFIPSLILQGDHIVATIPVLNDGVALGIDGYPETRIYFRRNDNGQIQPVDNLVRTDGNTTLTGGGVITELEFEFDIPAEYPVGLIDVYVVLSLGEGNLVVAPEDSNGSILVLQAGNANYVAGSLNPDEVVPRETVYFSASFENTGSARIELTAAESTIEILDSGIGPVSLERQFILTGNSTTEIFFDPVTIPVDMSTGDYDVRWNLKGKLPNDSDYENTGVISNGLTVVSPASLRFSNINVVPDRVKQGQAGIDIIYRITNTGQSTANITGLDHQFNFTTGGQVPNNEWISTLVNPQLPFQLAPAENRYVTVTYTLSNNATTGMISPNPTVRYHDTRTPSIPFNSNTIIQNDQVEVVEPASVKIAQLRALSPNSPNVNEGQQFNLELTLENTGADQIQTAWVSIYRNQETESFRDLVLTNIAASEQKSTSFLHSEPTHATYFYRARIDSAIDAIGDPVDIDDPDDRDELVHVQLASRLEIDASIFSNDTITDSLRVSKDQIFMVQANITNFGESSFSPEGNGRLVLRFPSNNFTLVNGPSDSIQTFTSEDTVAKWEVQATDTSAGGIYEELMFSLTDIPIDMNTGQEVEDISISDSVVHIKSEEKGIILQNQLSILSPEGARDGILSTRQEFSVRSDIQFNGTIAQEGRAATITLPFGYSLKSGELTIDLSTGEPAQWTIIALERDRTGDEIFVTAVGTDRNSELPVDSISNAIPLSVVERADLTMTLQLVKTGGSIDTLSVGQNFTLQALISNEGTARAIGQGKVYLEGIEDNDAIVFSNLPQNDTLSYTVGEPVGWDLEIIQLPEGQSGIQSEMFRLLEEFDRENAKIATKGTNSSIQSARSRELFDQISNMVMALVTEEMNLTVKMSQFPEDENTNQVAFTQDSTVTKTIYIQPVAKITFQFIDLPGTVSTDQEFSVTVTGILENNLVNAYAHLAIPPSFMIANDNQSLISIPLEPETNQAIFNINVPTTVNYFGAERESLSVMLTGDDSNTGEPVIPSTPEVRFLTVQMKPEIYMAREIVAPIAAREAGTLSHGQSITIEVRPSLVNRPDALLNYAPIDSVGSIELDNEIFSRYNFEPIDGQTYKKTFTELDQILSFTLRAPRENQPAALIKLKFVDLPFDNNSKEFVDVNSDSGSVSLPMTVTEKKITVIMQSDYEKTTFTRGKGQHLMMAFEISNNGYLDPLSLKGLRIRFIARSDTASLLENAIVNIFEKIDIVDFDEFSSGPEKISDLTSYAEYVITEANVSNPLQINFDELGYLEGNESKNLAVVAMFREGESSRSFRTVLENVDAYDDSPEHLVSIVDAEGRSIKGNPNYQSDVFSVISTDQEQTFGNFPNPFGRAPNETTEIRFVLNSTSDVTLRIFSLAGELVKSVWNQNLTNLPGGEIFYVVWDGKNDEGDTVLNGVYICVIELRSSAGTKTYTTKIAYIK